MHGVFSTQQFLPPFTSYIVLGTREISKDFLEADREHVLLPCSNAMGYKYIDEFLEVNWLSHETLGKFLTLSRLFLGLVSIYCKMISTIDPRHGDNIF